MLDAATRMLLECPTGDVLGALRPVDVARRSEPPRTTGAFYNIWPTQADFREALLDHVLSLPSLHGARAGMDLFDDLIATPDAGARSVVDAMRVTANAAFDGLKDDPAIRLQHALWTLSGPDPQVRARLGRRYGSISTTVVPRYARLLERAGRRMAEPFTVEVLAVAIAALAEGLHLRWAVDPGAVPDDIGPPPGVPDDERRWSTFATLAHVLVRGMTEPLPDEPDDPEEVDG
jgi:AcrR family transcriptional regulator